VRGKRIFHRIVRKISLEEAPLIVRHNSAGGINTDPIARLRRSVIANARSVMKNAMGRMNRTFTE
jgi:hypothetical protein